MKFNHFLSEKRSNGYALIITLFFLGVMLIVFASMMSWTSSNARLTERNNLYNQSQVAAESATEQVLAAMISDFDNNTAFSSTTTYATMVPAMTGWPVQYVFSDTNGNTGQISVAISNYTNTTSLPNQVANTSGWGNTITVVAQASPVNQRYNMTARVSQNVWMGVIPLFQFAIFYNMDLEINPGAAMTVNGRVHSNHNLYASGSAAASPLTFGSSVEAALMATNHSNNPTDPQNNRGGNVVYSNTNYPLQNVGTLNLPVGVINTNSSANNPSNVLAILYPPPAAYSAPNYNSQYLSSNGVTYFENTVDLIITNSPNGTNGSAGKGIQVYYQNPNEPAGSQLMAVPPDVTNIVSGVTNIYYSFVTNSSFYDYRQASTVQSLDIDVGKMNQWMTNGAGTYYNNLNTSGTTTKHHGINSIYAINAVPQTTATMPAVRMVDGQMLPTNGLTVATPDPIYVKGDYNTTTNGTVFSNTLGDTTNTYPASLLGDSLTLLSSSWSDANNASTALASRVPVNTVLNAATLEGIDPSNTNHYSGGVENFVRLLENWSGYTLTYNGSIVVMFPSQIATSPWQTTGNYYNAPTRRWGFDVNFNQQGRLPPLTPAARTVLRASWSAN